MSVRRFAAFAAVVFTACTGAAVANPLAPSGHDREVCVYDPVTRGALCVSDRLPHPADVPDTPDVPDLGDLGPW